MKTSALATSAAIAALSLIVSHNTYAQGAFPSYILVRRAP